MNPIYSQARKPSVVHRQQMMGEHRLDFMSERELVVELKTATGFELIHLATSRSYLEATKCEVRLLLNFAATKLEIERVGRERHQRGV